MDSVDLGLLVSLDALLQEGSVSGAARRIGLSTPAMSHALARIRERLGDPILIRSGRGMILTPRALALKPRVHTVISEARLALEPERPFVARDLSRTFVVHATDYVLTILGSAVDRLLVEKAPRACLRFVPNTPDDPLWLRDQGSDLSVGIYGDLPQEMRHRPLLTDRFVAVVRRGHPMVGKRFTLEDYVTLAHIQVLEMGGSKPDAVGFHVRRTKRKSHEAFGRKVPEPSNLGMKGTLGKVLEAAPSNLALPSAWGHSGPMLPERGQPQHGAC